MRWDRSELFEQALDAGQGVILALPHIGCWEMIGQSLAERYGPTRPTRRPVPPRAKGLVGTTGGQFTQPPGPAGPCPPAFPVCATSCVYCALAAIPPSLPDQGATCRPGRLGALLGKPAYTMTLLARLAQQSGAAVLLC